MRITALRPLVRSLHTSRAVLNAASSSTSSAATAQSAESEEGREKDVAVPVTESGRRDIKDVKAAAIPRSKGTQSRSKKANIASDEIPMDALSSEPDAAAVDAVEDFLNTRQSPRKAGAPRQQQDGRSRRDQPQQRGSREGRENRDRETRDDRRGNDRNARSGSDTPSGAARPERRARAGAAQRAAARSAPRPSGSFGSELDLQSDNRPRGKQAVEPVQFDSSFSALFGKASLISAAAVKAQKGEGAEKSAWAVQRGMKPDEARRERILRAAGQYVSETPTSGFPSTLPSQTSASQRAKTIGQWAMAMNPSIPIGAQQQAGKVFDAFLK